MGAAGRFWVVLDGEGLGVGGFEAFAGAVVEVDMGALCGGAEGVHVYDEAVILRGDLDAAGGEIFDRLVEAAVAEFELVGVGAERTGEQLMA